VCSSFFAALFFVTCREAVNQAGHYICGDGMLMEEKAGPMQMMLR
jgi:hypothetical protein